MFGVTWPAVPPPVSTIFFIFSPIFHTYIRSPIRTERSFHIKLHPFGRQRGSRERDLNAACESKSHRLEESVGFYLYLFHDKIIISQVQPAFSIFNTGFSWLQSWEECAKQTRLQHGFKALCWRLSLRRIAELREGRRTECVAQLARDQRSRFTTAYAVIIKTEAGFVNEQRFTPARNCPRFKWMICFRQPNCKYSLPELVTEISCEKSRPRYVILTKHSIKLIMLISVFRYQMAKKSLPAGRNVRPIRSSDR